MLTTKGKLDLIAERLGIAVDYGSMPWQIVPEIVGVRNKIATEQTNTPGRTRVTVDPTTKKLAKPPRHCRIMLLNIRRDIRWRN